MLPKLVKFFTADKCVNFALNSLLLAAGMKCPHIRTSGLRSV